MSVENRMAIYNREDHKAARQARRDAVIFLRSKGYSWRATGYALGITGGRAMELWHNETRKRGVRPLPCL